MAPGTVRLTGARVALIAALVVWMVYAAVLLLELSAGGRRVLGVLPGATASYVMTLLLLWALPRRSLLGIALLSAAAVVLPELVSSSLSSDVAAARPFFDLLAVLGALAPVRIERMRGEWHALSTGGGLGAAAASTTRQGGTVTSSRIRPHRGAASPVLRRLQTVDAGDLVAGRPE